MIAVCTHNKRRRLPVLQRGKRIVIEISGALALGFSLGIFASFALVRALDRLARNKPGKDNESEKGK
jgi:hypothetical protein